MDEKYFGPKIAIEESEKVLKEQMESVETFKSHQGRLLTVISFIISVIGLLIGLREEPLEVSPVILISIVTLFVCFLVIYAFIIAPVKLEMPIKVEFDIFKEIFFGKPEKTVLENKLANYIKAIKNNRKKTNRLYIWSLISTTIFILFVLLVVGSIFVFIW